MLLKDLFQLLPEDYGTLPTPNVPSFDPRYSKIVGKFDIYDIWASREILNCDVYGIRDTNGEVLSLCRIASHGTDNIRAFEEVWTRNDKRGQGLATVIMLFILRKVGIKLLLQKDAFISDDSRGMIWKGLAAYKFKMFNTDGTQVDLKTAKTILFTLGKTNDEVILSEEKLNFEMFSSIKKDSQSTWYLVVGMNQDLD